MRAIGRISPDSLGTCISWVQTTVISKSSDYLGPISWGIVWPLLFITIWKLVRFSCFAAPAPSSVDDLFETTKFSYEYTASSQFSTCTLWGQFSNKAAMREQKREGDTEKYRTISTDSQLELDRVNNRWVWTFVFFVSGRNSSSASAEVRQCRGRNYISFFSIDETISVILRTAHQSIQRVHIS